MEENRFLKWLIIAFVALNLYSAIPIASFYLTKTPKIESTNETVIKELKSNKDSNFRFIVMSDTGSGLFLNEAATLKVISGINREGRFRKAPVDFVLNVGDVTFRGKRRHYDNYIKLRRMIKYPVLDAIGNHDDDIDDGPRGLALFNKYCGVREFSFVNGNSYFIVLDNKDGSLTEKQFRDLEVDLIKGGVYAHTFIFMHKPPFNPIQQSWYKAERNPWSQRFLKLCDKHNVDIVFAGHEDAAKVIKLGNVTYVVSGGGGTLLETPASEGGYLHYISVNVNGDYLTHEIRKVYPPVWEFFAFYMWKELFWFARGLLN